MRMVAHVSNQVLVNAADLSSLVAEAVDTSPAAGWLLVWDLDPLGDCCCPRRASCPRPGKHPWWRTARSVNGVDTGVEEGFRHGALSALGTRAEIPAEWLRAAGNRLAAVPGDSLLVLDLDSDRAWRTFVRVIGDHVSSEFLGASRSPRGWHIWLAMAADGWTQSSARRWMNGWLGDNWGGVDIRTGSGSFLVWPGGMHGDRFWVPAAEFAERVAADWQDFSALGLRVGNPAWGPPWRATGTRVTEHQKRWSVDAARENPLEGLEGMEPEDAWARLDRACVRVAEAVQGTRNNCLNVAAFYQGAAVCWLDGSAQAEVTRRLMDAYRVPGWNGNDSAGLATIASGLRAGAARMAARARQPG